MAVLAAGQVALLSFPFSDLSHNKLRPAVLLASVGREDWIVCQITSNPFGDTHSLILAASDFAVGTLQRTSYVRPGKIFTAHESLIANVAGTLKPEAFDAIRRAVIGIIQQS